MNALRTFVLASASPRRRELLAGQGLSFDVRASDVPEIPRPGESAADFTLRVAGDKAAAVANQQPGALVLAADTAVVLGGRILGKPADAAEAAAMLASLAGNTHEVITGVCVRGPRGTERFAVRTAVRFRPIGAAEIRRYVAGGEPLDKAGAYAIQGAGGAFVEAIFGSYSNVVGLPLAETLAALRRAGLALPWEDVAPESGAEDGIAERLAAVRGRIAQACAAAGRDPAEVTLVAVSKTHSADAIRAAYAAGHRDFGENYAQELRDKMRELADLPDLRWHAIGHLQANKAKYVAGKALVHTIDRADLARELVRRAGGPVDGLVEVNVADEPQKSGVSPADLPALLAELRAIEGLHVAGLMCIPPDADDPEAARPHFRRLRTLRDELLPGGALSMGMSHDYAVAIAEGATLVRVGTAIFGARPPRTTESA